MSFLYKKKYLKYKNKYINLKNKFIQVGKGLYDIKTIIKENGDIYEGIFDEYGKIIRGKIIKSDNSNKIIYTGIYDSNEKLLEGLAQHNKNPTFVNRQIEKNTYVDFEKILEFLNLNIDKIYIPDNKIGIYKISMEQLQKIKQNISEKSGLTSEDINDSLDFLDKLIEIFRYVPFDEYTEKIKQMSEEIINYLTMNHENYDEIYYVMNSKIVGSNTWIGLLFLHRLKDFLLLHQNISNKIKFMNYFPINENIDTGKKLLLFFDDMSYSGLQISQALPSSNYCINYDIYITTPYISTTAINNIKATDHNFNIWNQTEIIESLETSFTRNDINGKYKALYDKFCFKKYNQLDRNYRNTFYNGFQCHNNIIPIYFDHKIADGISTFQKLLFLGTYPIKNGECIITPLINNCFEENFQLADNFDKNRLCNEPIQNIYYFGNTCLNTYYKTIQYNFTCPIDNNSFYNNNTLIYLLKYSDLYNDF